ncbi:MAG TPA: hypothetical protein VKB34_00445 [Povalibacter sp.]|nr:hypothetical protein [Povalibacter sp.]
MIHPADLFESGLDAGADAASAIGRRLRSDVNPGRRLRRCRIAGLRLMT